ncbi:MAG: porin [Oligoflexus sp.]
MIGAWQRGLALSGLICAAHTAQAQDDNVKTFHFGGQYHFNLFYSDDGLNDAEAAGRTASQRFGVNARAAKLVFKSGLAENVDLMVRYSMTSNQLEYAYLDYKVNSALTLTVGRTKERIFGWHRRQTSSLTPVTAAYLSLKPFGYPDGVQATYKLGNHKFLLQVVKDFFDCNGAQCDSWNELDANGREKQKQPAILSEWIGTFGAIQPLVQYASYDQGKSSTYTAGIRYNTQRFDVYGDYVVDNRVKRGVDAGQTRKEENVMTGYVVHGEWNQGKFTPFFHISSFAYDEFTAPGQTATEVNSAYTQFDDNNMTWGIGSHYNLVNEVFRPYVVLFSKSGDFVDPQDASKSKPMAEMQVVAGVTGNF